MLYFLAFLGTFIEGEISLMVCGYYLTQGSFFILGIMAFLGTWLADLMWFFMGYYGRKRPLLPARTKLGRWVQKSFKAIPWIESNPYYGITVLRFQMFMRAWALYHLGRHGFSFRIFLKWNTLACFIWTVVMTLLAHHIFQLFQLLKRLFEGLIYT